MNDTDTVDRRLSVWYRVTAPSFLISRASVSPALIINEFDSAPGTPGRYPEILKLSSGRSMADSSTSNVVRRPSRELKLNAPAYDKRSWRTTVEYGTTDPAEISKLFRFVARPQPRPTFTRPSSGGAMPLATVAVSSEDSIDTEIFSGLPAAAVLVTPVFDRVCAQAADAWNRTTAARRPASLMPARRVTARSPCRRAAARCSD